jgi:dynein heavy chain, axonemal
MEIPPAVEGHDTRFEFMGQFVQKTLRLKPEKWSRLMTQEEYKTIIKDFLDQPVPVVLIISEKP